MQGMLFKDLPEHDTPKYEPNDYTKIGQIGEAYCLYRIRHIGHYASPMAEGFPFDIMMQANGKILRVQVKTTQCAKDGYFTFLTHKGRYAKNPDRGQCKSAYNEQDYDVAALVALSVERVHFLYVKQAGESYSVPVWQMIDKENEMKSLEIAIKEFCFVQSGGSCA